MRCKTIDFSAQVRLMWLDRAFKRETVREQLPRIYEWMVSLREVQS